MKIAVIAMIIFCVGHDAVFAKASEAPVTTLIAKDRVLAHNPAAAIYSRYIRKRFSESIWWSCMMDQTFRATEIEIGFPGP